VASITSFAVLGLLVVAGVWAVERARRFAAVVDDRRHAIESLTGLVGCANLTEDERRAVGAVVEMRLQRL
jgi:hypothetical protein